MTAHTARRVDDRVRLLKTARFYCIFKFKGIILTLVQPSSFQAQFAGTPFVFKKPRVGFQDLAFEDQESKFDQRNLEPYFLLSVSFSQPARILICRFADYE